MYQATLHPMNRFALKHALADTASTTQSQADTAEPGLSGRREVLRQLKRVRTGTITACLRGSVSGGAEKIQDHELPGISLIFHGHLAWARKKGDHGCMCHGGIKKLRQAEIALLQMSAV